MGLLCLLYFLIVWLKLLITPRQSENRPILRHRVKFALLAGLTLVYVSGEVDGNMASSIGEMPMRMIQWLPGRRLYLAKGPTVVVIARR